VPIDVLGLIYLAKLVHYWQFSERILHKTSNILNARNQDSIVATSFRRHLGEVAANRGAGYQSRLFHIAYESV